MPTTAVVTQGDGWVVVTDQGQRDYMEDTHAARTFSWDQGWRRLNVYGVFDGHNGATVAQHCARHLPRHVANVLRGQATSIGAVPGCLHDAFHQVDDNMVDVPALRANDIGCTACVAVVTHTDVWVANAGDSRAFIRTVDGEIVLMSEDHKPCTPTEHARILRSPGGFVSHADGTARVQGRLSLSRSLGDQAMRPHVICTPDVRRWQRTKGKQIGGAASAPCYMIVASDGVWDVLNNDEVAKIVDIRAPLAMGSGYGAVIDALCRVLAEARRRRSGDNITIMFVAL